MMSATHKVRECKPSFIVRPRRQFIDEGGRAKFKTSFDGEPAPSVKWMKNELELEDGDKYRIYEKNSFCFLEVLSASPDDNGDYVCIISNHLGTAEVSAELEVFCKPKPRIPTSLISRVAPSFEKQLCDCTATEGTALKLECLLNGHPKPFIQWYFNGKMLRRSHGGHEEFDGTTATLTITDVCAKHAGSYECVASNTVGEVRSACVVTVQAAPSSAISPSDDLPEDALEKEEKLTRLSEKQQSDVPEKSTKDEVALEVSVGKISTEQGSHLQKSCQSEESRDVLGTREPSEKSEDKDEIQIENKDLMKREDELEMLVRTEEKQGQDTGIESMGIEKTLTTTDEKISPTESVLSLPKKETVVTEKVSLTSEKECLTAEAKPSAIEKEPVVVEEEPSSPLEKSSSIRQDTLTKEREQPLKKTLEDRSERPVAENESVITKKHQTNVEEQQLKVEKQDADVVEDVSEETIQSEGHSLGVKNVETLKTVSTLITDSSDLTSPTSSLKDVSEREDGHKEVPLFNENLALSISEPLQNRLVNEGDVVKLECQISGMSSVGRHMNGRSELDVSWSKDGQLLTSRGNFVMQTSGDRASLEIAKCLLTDSGEYKCVVQCGTIKAWTSCLLTVQQSVARKVNSEPDETENKSQSIAQKEGEPPSFVKELHDLEVNDGDWVELEVQIKGDKPIEVCWLHGNHDIREDKVYKLISEGDTHKLIIRDAFPEDSGRYICEIYNKYGDDETSCVLTIKEPHGEGTSPFSKVGGVKRQSPAVTCRADIISDEKRPEQSAATPTADDDRDGHAQPSEQTGGGRGLKVQRSPDSQLAQSKKTRGSDVSRAVRVENIARISKDVKTGSRFAKSKQMFESPTVAKVEKKVDVPVRKLKERFEPAGAERKPLQRPAEHRWRQANLRPAKTAEVRTDVERPLESTPQSPLMGDPQPARAAAPPVDVKEQPRSVGQPSAGVGRPCPHVVQPAALSAEASPVVATRTRAAVRETSQEESPDRSIDRVLPVVTKTQPSTIRVASIKSPASAAPQLPMIEILVSPEGICQKAVTRELVVQNNDVSAIQFDKPCTEEVAEPGSGRTERKRFVSSVTFATIGTASRAPAQSTAFAVRAEPSSYTGSGRQELQSAVGEGVVAKSRPSADPEERGLPSAGLAASSEPSGERTPEGGASCSLVVVDATSPAPALRTVDFTIDLKTSQVISVTSAASQGCLDQRRAIPLEDCPPAVGGRDTPSAGGAPLVKPKPVRQRPVDTTVGSSFVVAEEASPSKQTIVAKDTMTSFPDARDDPDGVVSGFRADVPSTRGVPPDGQQNPSFSSVRSRFESSQRAGSSGQGASSRCSGSLDHSASACRRPSFTRRPKSLNVDEGSTALFAAQVKSDPPPSVEWQRNGECLSENERFKFHQMENTYTLEICHVLSTDAGRYTCLVTNPEGSDRSSASLVVKQIESSEVTDFRGLLKARPQLRRFHIQNNSDKCWGARAAGCEQKDFRAVLRRHPVVMHEQPKFATVLQDSLVREGERVALQVKVTGSPPPKITWCHDNKEIKASEYFKMSYSPVSHVAELIIAEAFPEDAGVYLCKAESDAGYAEISCLLRVTEVKSRETSLNEQPSPESIPRAEAKPGVSDDFSASPGKGSCEVFGVSLGEKSSSDACVVVSEQKELSRLEIPEKDDLSKTDHSLAEDTSKMTERDLGANAALVDEGVDVTQSTVSDGVYVGASCSQHVITRSISSGSRSGTEPENDEDQGVLTRVDSDSQDTDRCDSVEQKRDGRITLPSRDVTGDPECVDPERQRSPEEEPPMIMNLWPQSLNVLKGGDIKLSGTFIGNPPPTVKWFVEECRTRTEILPDDRISISTTDNSSILHITDSDEDNTGIYTLEISNHLGLNHLSSSVTVEGKPDPPVSQPFISNITMNSLTLSWYGASYDGGSSILFYQVEMRKEKELEWVVLSDTVKHTSYTVNDLEANKGYEFRVRAGNRHGFGEASKASDIVFTMETQPTDGEDELPFEPRTVDVKTDQKFEDNYYLGEQIGRGKFGCVYKCIEKISGRQLAAKFIKAARISQKADVKQEINVMNALHHPKLLLLWDAYESKKEVVLVMEHIGGGELLSRVVDEDYVLTERECVHFMRQICDGVKFIHQQNIVHLDLKPENVMCITKNSNEIKIIDFGLARKLDLNKDNRVMFGTAEFVAPEVVNYDAIGLGTDMWSVGVVCYILLSGLSPFAGESDADTFSNVTMAQYDFDEEEFEEISDDAKHFIDKLLKKDLKKRMSAHDCLKHQWLAQDVKYMKAKRLSTEKHKRFLNRIKWRKAKFAVEMINRMQKVVGAGVFGRTTSRSSLSRSVSSSSTQSAAVSEFSDGDKPGGGVKMNGADMNTNNNNSKRNTLDVNSILNGKVVSENESDGTQTVQVSKCPVFTVQMKDQEVSEGDGARFDVRLIASEGLKVSWYKDDLELNGSTDKYQFYCDDDSLHYCLMITDCQGRDASRYECHVKNNHGEAECSALLRVTPANAKQP